VKKGFPVVLATCNAGKVREFNRLLAGVLDVLPLPSGVALPAETELTFAANARLKAQSAFESLGCMQAVLADDSGLEVSAMGGRPGIYSARFAGERATDTENVAKLLAELEGPPIEVRSSCAHYVWSRRVIGQWTRGAARRPAATDSWRS